MENGQSSGAVGVWVCPNCDVLMGIETRVLDDKITANCLSCGTSLNFIDVHFLSEPLVRALSNEVLTAFPDHIHEDIRFSWVSNKTLGLIFSIPIEELLEEIDFDIEEEIEDALSEKYDMNVTVYYE